MLHALLLPSVLVALAALYLTLGNLGIRKQRRMKPKRWRTPLVSVIIPSYRSGKTIKKTIRSALSLDYPRKEIVVVNDSRDSVPEICESMGVKCIQNPVRTGKPRSMARGLKASRGEFVLFLDSDTVISKTFLRKAVPWFSDSGVAAVIPKYRSLNRKGFSALADIEDSVMSSLVRMTTFFGTAFGLRGCAVLTRRSALEETGIPETLTEDNELSALILESGKRIAYEESATALTREPESLKALMRQKSRWGKGSLFVFLRHYRFYLSSPAFLLFFFPYIITGLLFSLFASYHATLSLFNPSELNNLTFLSACFFAAQAIHVYALSSGPKPKIRNTMLFVALYLPLATLFYAKGMLSAMVARIRKRPELDLSEW